MRDISFECEQTPAAHKRELQARLDKFYEMILDTKAEIAQVKKDAIEDPDRAKELDFLNIALKTLEDDERTLKQEFEEIHNKNQ